jgi:hypothetical protein
MFHMKQWLTVLFVAFALLLGGATAYAQDGDEPAEQQPAVEAADDHEQSTTETIQNIAPFEMWEMIVGTFVAGFIVPIVQKRRYSEQARIAIALAVAAVTAIIGSYFRGELDNVTYTSATIMHMAGIVYVAYQTIWKAKFLNAVPNSIETKVLA